MRKLTLGSLAVAATAALAVPVIGLAGSPSTSILHPLKPPVAAAATDGLPAFSSCDELLDWYVEKALPLVGPYGFGYPNRYVRGVFNGPVALQEVHGAMAKAAAPEDSLDTAARNSATGTNVQEAGVDEPDNAKTNGSLVLRVENRELIVTDVSGKDPAELSRTKLPKGFWGDELLLSGDDVLLFGENGGPRYYGPMMGDIARPYQPFESNTRLVSFSIADPKAPTLKTDQVFEGTLVEARQYGDTIRLILQNGYPDLDFVQPNRRRTEAEARKENKQIVRDSTIGDWLPTVLVDGKRTPTVGCGDVRHPRTNSGFGTLSIVTFAAATPTDRTATAVTTSGDLAYSSATHLYVATSVNRPMPIPLDEGDRVTDWAPATTTEIHEFKIDGPATTYVASGVVRGTVRDRWSFDEYDGYLRVATALMHKWEITDNAITVLHADGSKLKVVSSVRHIGPREDIQSVRWMDDLAVVVTFRQIDPLYTVDLSDPAAPKVLGALRIPGFSSYLHPMGDHKVLGLGTAAGPGGSTQGGQIATFDLRNLKDPKQLDVLRLGMQDELVASYDPRGFTLVPWKCPPNADCLLGDHEVALAAVSDWNGYNHIVEVRVSPDGRLTQVDRFPSRSSTRILPIGENRVALVGRFVRIRQIG
jgi:hypothetical protein